MLSKHDPAAVFLTRDRVASFWFAGFLAAAAAAAVLPVAAVYKLKQSERVVILDAAGTCYVSPLRDFEGARELHTAMARLAAEALLMRSPAGADRPEALSRLFLKNAHARALELIKAETPEFGAKGLHQKAEVREVRVIDTRSEAVAAAVDGQLIRAGRSPALGPVTEGREFTLHLRLVRNPDLSVNGRYPMAVESFELTVR